MIEENFEKGKKAEKIVKQMFKEAGFKVKKSGYENTFGDLADKDNLIQGPAAKYIRHYPDFIVVDPSNNAYLIEVKYRRFGEIKQGDMFNFPETQVILLTKDSMHCQSLKQIHKGGKKFLSLDALKPFSDIPLGIREKYIKKMRRWLGDENIIGQLIENISEKIVGKNFKQPYTPGGIRFKYTYIESYNPEGDSYENTGDREIISNRHEAEITSNDKKQWSEHETSLLKDYYNTGMAINDIAGNLGRKREAVIFRLARLGLINMRQAVGLVRGRNQGHHHGRLGRGNRRAQRNRWKQRQRHKKRRR